MGYSHYWTISNSLTLEEFTQLQIDFVTLKLHSNVDIRPETSCGWSSFFQHKDELKPYALKQMAIVFNGIADDSHETMSLRNHESKFECCKTAQKPYDEVVTALLLWTKYKHLDFIDVRTDGGSGEWQPAIDLIRMALSVEIDIAVEDEDGRIFITGTKDVLPSVVFDQYKNYKLAGAFS